MKSFEGAFVALATPFRSGAFDEEAYRGLIRHQLENGTQGLVPIGTTGEAATMSAEERTRAVKVAVELARGKVPVIGGAGADAALVVTPYYNKPTQGGLFEHYRAIAKANPGFPIVAYNVPGRTGVDLLPETCLRLCEIPEVVAVKEATGSMPRAIEIAEKCGERLTLLSGDDFTILPFISCRGKGVIYVSATVAPRMIADLVKQARSGQLAKA